MFETRNLDAENLVREILENTTDNIYFKDMKSRFVLINNAFCDWVGMREEEIIGKTDFDLFPDGPHAQKAFDAEQNIIKTGEPIIGLEEEEIWPDGHITWVSTSKMPWKDNDGKIKGTCGISRDITAAKQLELQLAQARKLETVGQLAAGIAHEINTPIQFVSDNLHFLQDSVQDLIALSEQHRKFVEAAKKSGVDPSIIAEQEKIIDEADIDYLIEELPIAIRQSLEGASRVSKIVRAMKEFSHPGETLKSDADINEAIRTTITVAKNEWKYVAKMNTDLDENLPSIPCLVSELNQVFLNMIINARDAIEETGNNGEITLKTRYDDQWVIVTISDTGAGMPPAVQKRIFDPFYTTKEVGKGSGQGLAIAHNVIVNKHGGAISVSSEPGKGTAFEIQLPRRQPDHTALETA